MIWVCDMDNENGERYTFTNEPIFRNLFDGTLQKYRYKCGFPNHKLDSWSMWTHIEGCVYAHNYTELINTIHFHLLINDYPTHLNIQFEKV